VSLALLYHLGDLRLTLASAAAIAAWLVATHARRAAARWICAFGVALGLVTASKIAYLAWGTALPSFRFKALSGHATGFAATCLVLAWLATWRRGPALRNGALFAATILSLAVATSLVQAGEHTAAEAAGGWVVGSTAALVTIRRLDREDIECDGSAPAWSLLVFGVCIVLTGRIPANAWLVGTALVLSGHQTVHRWQQDAADIPTMTDRRHRCPDPYLSPSHGSPIASSTTRPCVR